MKKIFTPLRLAPATFLLILGVVVFGLSSLSEGSQLSLLALGEGTDAPAPLLNLLQEQIAPSDPSGSYAATYRGWQAYFTVLPHAESALVNPPAALRRAEEQSFRRVLQDLLEELGLFEDLQHRSLGVSAVLHLRGKLLMHLESAPGLWKRNGFFEGMPWNLLLLPPGNLSVTAISPDLPSREELLPVYRRLSLQEARGLRRGGTPEESLPYYREWLTLSPLGPSTPSLLEYAEALIESNHPEEARNLLEKTREQRKDMLSEGEAYSLRLLWEHTLPATGETEE